MERGKAQGEVNIYIVNLEIPCLTSPFSVFALDFLLFSTVDMRVDVRHFLLFLEKSGR